MVLFSVTFSDPYLHQTTAISTFCIAFHIFVVDGARDFKLDRQVDRSKYQPSDNKQSPLKGCGQGHVASLFTFCPNHNFGIKARHFKCCMLIDTQTYHCMRDILPPKRMCSESRDLFKHWEITDNISLTMQDEDIVSTGN